MQLQRHMRIELLDHRRRARRLGHADVGRGMDHLALQVRQRHRVVVDNADGADAGGGEIEERRRAEPARADHQHTRALERVLAGSADLAQHDMAGIAFEFIRAQHGGAYIASPARTSRTCAAGRCARFAAGRVRTGVVMRFAAVVLALSMAALPPRHPSLAWPRRRSPDTVHARSRGHEKGRAQGQAQSKKAAPKAKDAKKGKAQPVPARLCQPVRYADARGDPVRPQLDRPLHRPGQWRIRRPLGIGRARLPELARFSRDRRVDGGRARRTGSLGARTAGTRRLADGRGPRNRRAAWHADQANAATEQVAQRHALAIGAGTGADRDVPHPGAGHDARNGV